MNDALFALLCLALAMVFSLLCGYTLGRWSGLAEGRGDRRTIKNTRARPTKPGTRNLSQQLSPAPTGKKPLKCRRRDNR